MSSFLTAILATFCNPNNFTSRNHIGSVSRRLKNSKTSSCHPLYLRLSSVSVVELFYSLSRLFNFSSSSLHLPFANLLGIIFSSLDPSLVLFISFFLKSSYQPSHVKCFSRVQAFGCETVCCLSDLIKEYLKICYFDF